MHDPRLFALRGEFKSYLYRQERKNQEASPCFISAMGFRPILHFIFSRGVEDRSFSNRINIEEETECFCEAFFGFLSGLALRPNMDRTYAGREIDLFIKRVLEIYQK